MSYLSRVNVSVSLLALLIVAVSSSLVLKAGNEIIYLVIMGSDLFNFKFDNYIAEVRS